MTLRQIDIPAGWVSEGKLGPLPEMLSTRSANADLRELQGSMIFVFPAIENQAESIFDVPGVLDWFRLLHATIPYVTYFMVPEASAGSLEGLILARLGRDALEQDSENGGLERLIECLAVSMTRCAQFATQVGDDWEPIVTRFLTPLDPSLRAVVIDTVREQGL